ncbi:MAG: SDR family oxidoreductase [Brevinematia bacterium]
MESNKGVVVITGVDSGIGKSLCELFVKEGYIVIASYLEENPFADNEKVLAKKMDLRVEPEIEAFAGFVKEIFNKGTKVNLLINNAGIALGGPIENLPMKIFREVFEVNFFGLVSLTQKLIPLLLETKGMIVNVGSMAGVIAMPFLAPYVSTKFALEGFTDSLRRELSPLGVKVVLLEVGGVNTPIWQKARKQDISFVEKKYMKSLEEFGKNFIDTAKNAMSPDKAALQIYKVIRKKNPKTSYIIAEGKFLTFLTTLLPKKFIDGYVRKLFSMYE